jgi:hypothetical protein
MNRAAWLQDRRMQKFRDVLSRWERGELSMMEAYQPVYPTGVHSSPWMPELFRSTATCQLLALADFDRDVYCRYPGRHRNHCGRGGCGKGVNANCW